MKKHKIYLYHASYAVHKDDILKNGLRLPNGKSNYDGMYAGEYIYLSATPEEAESYAETADNVPEEWMDEIIIFKVEVDMEDLELDPNNYGSLTYICPYGIKPEALTLLEGDELS